MFFQSGLPSDLCCTQLLTESHFYAVLEEFPGLLVCGIKGSFSSFVSR